MTNIGVTSILGSSLSVDQNSKYVQHGVCAATEELVGAWVYCSADAGGSATFKVVVYVEAAGIPAGLTHNSAACTVGAGSSWAWRYVTFTAGTNLTSGSHYYFGPHTASGGYNLNLKYQSTGGVNFEKADTYSDGPANPFGSGGGPGTRQYSVYLVTSPANSVPSAPTLVSPANAATLNVDYSNTFTWTHNDTDGDAQNEATLAYRESGGAWTETVIAGATAQKSIAGGTFSDGTSYEWKVKTSDAISGYGAYSSARTFTGTATPTDPTIDAPAVDEVIATSTYDIEWSIVAQDKFQARICADDGAGAPDTGNVLEDSGAVSESGTRSYTFDISDYNATTIHMQVRVEESAVWSDYASARCDVSFTPPLTPTVAVTASSSGGYISVTATHQSHFATSHTLYLQAATAPYTPTTKRGAWDDATSAYIYGMGTKSGAYAYVESTIGSLNADHDILLARYTYILPAKTTFKGTIDGVIGFKEDFADANAYLHLHVFATQGESDTLRGTIWTDYIDANEAALASDVSGEGFTGTMTEVACSAGDVLVLEVGGRCSSTDTGYKVKTHRGTTHATDLTDGGNATLYPGWIRLEHTEPDVSSEDIYRIALDDDNVLTRIATNHAAGTAYVDYAVASSFAADGISHRYEYVVRAVGDNGTTADSAQTG